MAIVPAEIFDVSINAERQPVTLFSFFDATGVAIAIANANEFVNITGNAALFTDSIPIGFQLDTSVLGDEFIRPQFNGPIAIRAYAKITGVTAANTARFALAVNQTLPLAGLTSIPDQQQDIAEPTGFQSVSTSLILESALAPRNTTTFAGATKIQVALAQTTAAAITLHRLAIYCERLDGVRGMGS